MADGALSKLPPITPRKKRGLTFLKAQAVKAAASPTHSIVEVKKVQKETANLLTERQAADWLGITIYTLQRIRKRGEISYCEIGSSIRYTFEQLQTYVASTSKTSCQKTDFKSETIGSHCVPVPPSGTQNGSSPGPDKHAAVLLAQKTFMKLK